MIQVHGTTLVRKVRQKGFTGLIVIRSANNDEESQAKYLSSGANMAIGKNIQIESLAQILMNAYSNLHEALSSREA